MAEERDEAPQGAGEGGTPSEHNMLTDLWRDHKTPIMVVIAGLTLVLTYVLVRQNAQSTGSATTAGGTPTLASGSSAGVPTAQTTDSTSAYYSLTSYMQSILQALQQLPQNLSTVSGGSTDSSSGGSTSSTSSPGSSSGAATGSTGSTSTPAPVQAAPAPAPVRAPAPTPAPAEQFVTVGHWTPNPAWNTTLSGIAQREGVTLARIEQLNPQIRNPNLIYPNEQVRVR